MAKGLLIAAMEFSDVAEDEFHDWYDTEHIPERLAVPGFVNADRWIGSDNPKLSVATYDLDAVGVLHSAPYRAVGGANGSPWTKRGTGRGKHIIRLEGDQILLGARRASGAALPRPGRDPALSGDVPLRTPRCARRRRLEKSRQHTMDRKDA